MGILDKFKKSEGKKKKEPFDIEGHKIKGVDAVNINTEMLAGDNAFAQAKFYKVILVAMFVMQLFSFQTASNLKETSRTHLIPLVGESMTVGYDYVDNGFLINMISFVNANYVSATPATARIQHALLMPHIHPSQFPDMQKRLDIRANTLKQLASTSLFATVDWSRSFQSKEKRDHSYEGITSRLWKVTFNTTRMMFVSGQAPEVENIKVELFYTVENGRFWIVDIIEVF
ncbi:TraE/TraK family type IV conjugative transfer system protein [Vibrio parahaemolyticus]|nr:TraE/TraK family type IV conjugative transfer system protein [Vibrio parahaemolyticus]